MLNKIDKETIEKILNPPGHNPKNINFWKILWKTAEWKKRIEVGFWITYIWCKPKYDKTVLIID